MRGHKRYMCSCRGQGSVTVGVNCQVCGFVSCNDFREAFSQNNPVSTPFAGPDCIIRIADLGITIGSALKTAQLHNVDNRIMYSAGVAARSLSGGSMTAHRLWHTAQRIRKEHIL